MPTKQTPEEKAAQLAFLAAPRGNHILCQSPTGSEYHLTPHECPHCGDVIWTCNCPSFIMGKMRGGEDPFLNPCYHVAEMLRRVGEAGLDSVEAILEKTP